MIDSVLVQKVHVFFLFVIFFFLFVLVSFLSLFLFYLFSFYLFLFYLFYLISLLSYLLSFLFSFLFISVFLLEAPLNHRRESTGLTVRSSMPLSFFVWDSLGRSWLSDHKGRYDLHYSPVGDTLPANHDW
jgi:hypothetical protein